MKRTIRKVAVLGSGIMGSRIACHFANTGIPVLLLDIVPGELNDAEKAKGLTIDSPEFRNRIVNSALRAAVESNPAPLYKKTFSSRITTGNFTDNMKDIGDCDWILEAVVENIEIKRSVYEQVEQHRKSGSLITSNTSGIPIRLMTDGRSEDFRKHFCGTHFFNPPRYLRLLEIIPAPETDPAVIEFLMEFGDRMLGKTTVRCKDTPAFIANRIGVYAIMSLLHHVEESGWSVEAVDKLTGPVLGRPKSATFRTTDVVGLDTMVHVANGLFANCPDDEARERFRLPAFIKTMVEKKWLGDKTKQGFYKKTKDEQGKSEILALDLKTLEYRRQEKIKFATLESVKGIDDLRTRMKMLYQGGDKAGEFYRKAFNGLFSYVSHRIPEISDELYRVDDAMKAGFAWELGPFETWDAVGVAESVKQMESAGHKPAAWVNEMLEDGITTFYKNEEGRLHCYDPAEKKYKEIPGGTSLIILDRIRQNNVVWKNAGTSLFDIGEGVLNLEFHTKLNTIGGEVLEGIHKAIDTAEKDFKGLVIGNDGPNFSAGANLAMVFMFAVEQEFDEIDFAVRAFQQANMRVRYSSVPVVVAPHGLTLGGGCEMSLHADQVQAAAETYIGMVEFGVGLIPGGGGSKEFTLRFSDSIREGDIELNLLRERFLTIAQAKVSTSAHEAFDLGIFRHGVDAVTMNRNRLIADARASVLDLHEAGYTKPVPRGNIRVLGRTGLGMVLAGANAMYSGHYMSEHDKLISEKLGWIMCGGDLSAPALVSEQYLLDLEREAFLSLCGEKKTLERIQSILTTGKPLRN
jgi:3-hydroxyacyl-CoA dehydrogenase